MRPFLFILLCLTTLAAVAQPPARRKAAEAQNARQNQPTARISAYRDFPTAQAMPSDVAWRRDIYRELDLTKDANAVLYYPTQPQDGRMNLFTFLFRQILRGQIKAYDYKLDGNEDFSEKNIVKAKEIMDRYKILYESKDGKIRVSDADLPSEEVRLYFIKESVYYDQHTASFHTKVTALCPVLKRGDDFGGEDSKYPMFWVKYEDIAPQLGKLMLMGSNLNNAAMMSADDFFTLGAYKGDIYKTTNLQDRILTNYCETDTALAKERQRIEKELTDFQNHVWGNDSVAAEQPDSTTADSTAAQKADKPRTVRRRTTASGRRTSSASSRKTTSAAKKKSSGSKSSATKPKRTSSRSTGLSVRRQRH